MRQVTPQTATGGERSPEEPAASLAALYDRRVRNAPSLAAPCHHPVQPALPQTAAMYDVDERVMWTASQATVHDGPLVTPQATAYCSCAASQGTVCYTCAQRAAPRTAVLDVDERVQTTAPYTAVFDIDERVSQTPPPSTGYDQRLQLSTAQIAVCGTGVQLSAAPRPAICSPPVPQTAIDSMPQTVSVSGEQRLPLLLACAITCNCEKPKVTTSCCEKAITQSCCSAFD